MYDVTDTDHFKPWVKELLHDRSIKDLRITFTKSDGTEREMLCTLLESAIPSDKHPKGTGAVASETTQRVFDLEKGEWRSFKWDTVKAVQFSTAGE